MAPPQGNDVLRALDKAKTQTYHFKAIIIAGMGFFTDAYDLFVISVLTKLLGRIYYYDPTHPSTPGVLPLNVNSAVLATALCGTLAGQLFFGWAGDKFGRKKVYGITLALMVVASLGQGMSLRNTPTSVLTVLCFFRFWLGFGIGGDYPLSATIMSEYSNTTTRGSFVAAVFAMQGIGILTGGAMCIIVSSIFKAAFPSGPWDAPGPNPGGILGQDSTVPQADWVWRLVLMFGAVPAALTFYSRSKMPETPRYTALVERDQTQAALDMGKVLNTEFTTAEEVHMVNAKKKATEFGLFSRKFARRHGLELFGTCLSWFLLDISFYSQNLFQSPIFTAVGWLPAAPTMSALQEVYMNGRAQALLALVSTVPGYWFTVAFIDIVGRKPIQIMGFFMMSAFLYVLAFDFYQLRGHVASKNAKPTHGNHIAFIVLYGFTFFFSNFGPNATTFIVPAELFPARLRSTCHGMASASGKAGAIVGTFGFLYAYQDSHQAAVATGYSKGIGYKYSLLLLAICATVGCVVTIFCVPETKGRSLEDLSGENEDDNAIADEQFGKENDGKVGDGNGAYAA